MCVAGESLFFLQLTAQSSPNIQQQSLMNDVKMNCNSNICGQHRGTKGERILKVIYLSLLELS